MIMSFAILLAMQAGSAPALDKPPAPPAGLEDLLDDYDLCIEHHRGGPLRITGDQRADRRRMERAISGCREQRGRGVAEADRLLAADPAFADASARAGHAEEAFAEVDERQRERLTTIYRQFGNSMHRSTQPLRGEASTDSFRSIDRPRPSGTTSIDVPFQIMPAYMDYGACISDRFAAVPGHDGQSEAIVRQAHATAVAQCRPVREQQLARAYAALNQDYRPFGNPRAARQAATEAFDRLETDFEVETAPAPSVQESPNAENR